MAGGHTRGWRRGPKVPFTCELCPGIAIDSETSLVLHCVSNSHLSSALCQALADPTAVRCGQDDMAGDCAICASGGPSIHALRAFRADGLLDACRAVAEVRRRDELRIGSDVVARVEKAQQERREFKAEVIAACPAEYRWFRKLEDLGTFEWSPRPVCPAKYQFQPAALLSRITLDVKPPLLVMPLPGVALPAIGSCIVPHRFPFEGPAVVPAAVAAMKGLHVASAVDVVMGSGALRMLSGLQRNGRLFVQRCNGTCFVHREHPPKDYADVGFAVERLCTGTLADEVRPDSASVENLTLAAVGPHRLLIVGEVDAMSEDGELVELKSGASGKCTRSFAQAVITGSARLINIGVSKTSRGAIVTGIDMDLNIEDALEEELHREALTIAGQQAASNLSWLLGQAQLNCASNPSPVFQICTDGARPSLKPSEKQILPPASVVRDLCDPVAVVAMRACGRPATRARRAWLERAAPRVW